MIANAGIGLAIQRSSRVKGDGRCTINAHHYSVNTIVYRNIKRMLVIGAFTSHP
jgi:hypothetical protein